jgi:hypothetical protein
MLSIRFRESYKSQRRYNVPKATLKRHLENKNKIANGQTKVLGRPTDFNQERPSR